MVKWIGALLGFFVKGFAGAIIGFVLGSFIDTLMKTKSSGFSLDFGSRQALSPKDFELNLLSLSSIVIKADGSVNQKELDYVRRYFVSAYGKERANATFRTFNEVIKKREISAPRICLYITQHTKYPARLQLLHFLFGIANADGNVSTAEALEIQKIAGYLKIHRGDFESIKAMFFRTADSSSAYTILEIDKNATDTEVKKAFRTMAKKYHPDKIQHLDEAHIKGAEAKFRAVQEAYEQIKNERGF